MPRSPSRRDFLTGVLACGTLTAAATYFLPDGRAPASVELNLFTGSDATGARQLLIDAWNNSNPHTRVRLREITGPSSTDQKRQMTAAANSGDADLLNLDIVHIRPFAEDGLITPVEVADSALFLDPVINAVRLDDTSDRCWAVPFNADVGMLFERVADGAPRSGTARLSDAIKVSLPEVFVGQLAPNSSASYEAFVVNVLEHALSVDDRILDSSGLPAYDLAQWQDALSPLHQAMAGGRVAAESNEDNTIDRFIANPRPRYMRNWPVHYRTLQQRADADVNAGRIRVHRLQPAGILGGQSLAVAARSRHEQRATEVIRFLTGEEAQKILAAYGLVPTQRVIFDDPNLKAFIPHLDIVRGAVEGAQVRPAHRNYAAFADAIVQHVGRLLMRDIPLPSRFVDDIRHALSG